MPRRPQRAPRPFCPPKRPSRFARFAPRLNRPPVPPAPTQQPAPFPNVANVLLLSVRLTAQNCSAPCFNQHAPSKHASNSVQKNAKNALDSLVKPFVTCNTTKEKLVRFPDNKRHTRRAVQARLVSLDNKQPKEKPEVMHPIKLFSCLLMSLGNNRKSRKRIPLVTTIKKKICRDLTQPATRQKKSKNTSTGHAPLNRAFTFQPRLCRPLRFFLRRPASNPLHRSQTP